MLNNLEKIKGIKNENERKVAEFLTRSGFSLIDSRSEFKKSEAEIAREIDLLFTFQNCLFIIEVSTLKSGRSEKIISFFYKWEKQRNLKRLKEKYPDAPNNVMRVFFDLSKPTPENKSQDIEEATEEKGNIVVYKDEFTRLNSNENVGQVIVDLLGLNWLENTAKIQFSC
ncbi:MAG: YraN family protein [Thaumarchaeota archaeon]|nr:YraN family protein [Nitrososphaerota archaeon]